MIRSAAYTKYLIFGRDYQFTLSTYSNLDAGKSTIGGQMMYLTGMVDKRTLEKYEREAKEKNRETWYLSWCMDTNQEGKHHSYRIYKNQDN